MSEFADATICRSCWCGSDRAIRVGEFALDSAVFTLVQCAGCGVQAIDPQPGDEELLSYYSDTYYGAPRRKFIGPLPAMIDWFLAARARMAMRLIRPPARVLDIGCGNGGFLLQLQRRGYHVEGTEWTAKSAARVPTNANIKVHVGEVQTLALPEHSFDLVSVWHVLEHMRQPYEALIQIRRLLREDGKVMIAVPNVESAQAKRFGLHWLHYDPPRHLFNFGNESLQRLLAEAGFEVQWSSTQSWEQNVFGHIQSSLNVKGKPRDRLYALLKGLRAANSSLPWSDLLWMGALLAPAMVINAIDTIHNRGATLIIAARPIRT